DSGSRVMIYADGYYRNGKVIDHKGSADIAYETAKKEGTTIEKILVWRRHHDRDLSNKPMVPNRDYYMDELIKNYRRVIVQPVSMDSTDPLFVMYTSGSTGKPKGCQHSTGGYLSYVTGTSKYYQDIHPE